MSEFAIYPIPLSSISAGIGTLALCPLPGRGGRFEADINTILRWNPDLVLSMTTQAEIDNANASELPERLALAETKWRHLPVQDFGEPDSETQNLWPEASRIAHNILDQGGGVLAHCHAGRGRSGMVAMRLMVERGIPGEQALAALRSIRPGAVETSAQEIWAANLPKPDISEK